MSMQQGMTWFKRQRAPITLTIIISAVAMAFIWWMLRLKHIENFVLVPDWGSKPWTLFTYPWAYMPFGGGLDILCFVFMCMWIFMTGGSIERHLGPVRTCILWLAMILLPALFIALLGPLTPGPFLVNGLWLPVAGITIVWCAQNPTSQIMMYGIIPLSGKWLGYVTLVATILICGLGNPLLGVFSALHLPIAYAFSTNRIPFWQYSGTGKKKVSLNDEQLKKTERMDSSYYDNVKKREKEREERERLRKLFESSIEEDK